MLPGWKLYAQGEFRGAFSAFNRLFEKVLAMDPNNTKGVLGKAWVACRQFRYEDAIVFFLKH
ncbi:MAG: hypothetical protein K9M01_05050 [Candidatus Omnitrophica bacterium]|nr:hypothetical protein [Candidatus Omnitrophota bacterium]